MQPMGHEHEQERISRIMRSLQNDDRSSDTPILAVNQLEAMRSKNGGYPRHMYHERLEPVLVINQKQEMALAEEGYVRNYIVRHFPMWIFRRNMDPKFGPQKDPATGKIQNTPFVEERLVRDRKHLDELLAEPLPFGCGHWCPSITEVEPLPSAPVEDPKVTIARLQGELAGVTQKLAEKEDSGKKKG